MSIGSIAESAFELGAELLVNKLTGGKGKDDHPALEAMLKEAARKAVAVGEEHLASEVRAILDVLGLALDIRDVADQAAEVPKAFEPDGSVPDLGLDITILGPDEKLEDATIKPIDARFDPETEK